MKDSKTEMKEEQDILEIKKKEGTVTKLDIVAMYSSIKFLLVKKVVQYFS